MDIDNWYRMVEKKAEQKKADVIWFKQRVRTKFIRNNNLLAKLSMPSFNF